MLVTTVYIVEWMVSIINIDKQRYKSEPIREFQTSIPIRFWYLGGMSRLENLSTPEL
jgi:hypothetical protein